MGNLGTNFSEDRRRSTAYDAINDPALRELLREFNPELHVTTLYKTDHLERLDKKGCDILVSGTVGGRETAGFLDTKARGRDFYDWNWEIGHWVLPEDAILESHSARTEAGERLLHAVISETKKGTAPWQVFSAMNDRADIRTDPYFNTAKPGWAMKGESDLIVTRYPSGVSIYAKKDLRILLKNLDYGLASGAVRVLTNAPRTDTTRDARGVGGQRLFTVSVLADIEWLTNLGGRYLLKDQSFLDRFPGPPIPELPVQNEARALSLHNMSPLSLVLRDPSRFLPRAKGSRPLPASSLAPANTPEQVHRGPSTSPPYTTTYEEVR